MPVPDYSVAATEMAKAFTQAKDATRDKHYSEARLALERMEEMALFWKLWLVRQK
jgi:hypothetical protein